MSEDYEAEQYLDEDLIPYFKCVYCDRNVCKDEVGKKLDHQNSREVICIDCDLEVE